MIQSRIAYSLVVYILIMILLFVSKPALSFDSDGRLKSFGVSDKNQTIYSVGVLSVCLAVFTFYAFVIIDLVFD